MDKDCFGEYNIEDCDCCEVAVECYEERNNQLIHGLNCLNYHGHATTTNKINMESEMMIQNTTHVSETEHETPRVGTKFTMRNMGTKWYGELIDIEHIKTNLGTFTFYHIKEIKGTRTATGYLSDFNCYDGEWTGYNLPDNFNGPFGPRKLVHKIISKTEVK